MSDSEFEGELDRLVETFKVAMRNLRRERHAYQQNGREVLMLGRVTEAGDIDCDSHIAPARVYPLRSDKKYQRR